VQFDAVIVAAGSSTRFGGRDKLFAELRGRPVLAWSLAAFEATEGLARLVVVTSPPNLEGVRALAAEWAPRSCHEVVVGGARRRDSVGEGLAMCSARYVAIHDGARPMITSELVAGAVEAAAGGPGAIVAVRVSDTIKEVSGGRITGHPDRSRLWAAQTPQVVLRQAWLDAARMSDNDETDDAAMLSRLGLECAVVEGGAENLKITRPVDLLVAEEILRARSGGAAP
jgi:2-C-methyl-D-erythritol 4-phosphate cytidylyltransferase